MFGEDRAERGEIGRASRGDGDGIWVDLSAWKRRDHAETGVVGEVQILQIVHAGNGLRQQFNAVIVHPNITKLRKFGKFEGERGANGI